MRVRVLALTEPNLLKEANLLTEPNLHESLAKVLLICC
jgi:hypothetical protein